MQHQAYLKDIQDLNKQGSVSRSSEIRSLDPFIDPQGILRVGGRIRHSIFIRVAEASGNSTLQASRIKVNHRTRAPVQSSCRLSRLVAYYQGKILADERQENDSVSIEKLQNMF